MKPLQGCNPLSLVSVGLNEGNDSDMKDEGILFDKSCSVAYQYCGRVLSDADSYKRHDNNVHQIKIPDLEEILVHQNCFK